MTSKTIHTIDPALLFQSLSTPYIVFGVDDPTFTILEENQAHATVAMVKREDSIGRPLFDVFPDTSPQYLETGVSALIESVRKVIRSKKPDRMPHLEYDLRDETGKFTKKYWAVTHYPVFDDKKKIVAVYQETKDITGEIAAAEKLNLAELTLEQILASALVGTWTWDLEKDRIYTDANLAKVFGVPLESAQQGLPLNIFMNSVYVEDRERVEAEIGERLKTLEPYDTEYRTTDAAGNIRWVIVRGKFTLDSAQKPRSFSGILFDITERKQAETAQIESESRLRFMADSMPQLVWIARADGYHEYYNQQWYNFTGTMPGATDGEGWNDLFHPDDKKRAWKVWQQCLKTGEPYEIEYRLYHAKSKTYRWVIGRALPFRDETGQIVKWYGTCTDVDEQKRTSQIQTFLADASKELASTLDYEQMLRTVTALCVPEVADWCSVDMYSPERGFEQVSIAHVDPTQISLAREYRERNPIHLDDPSGIPKILKTGETEFYPRITNEMLEQHIEDKENFRFMKSLNLHSIIIAPIRISNKIVGGISFISSDSGRYYTDIDLHMAEELAARISLAMTNARLYHDSQIDLQNRQKLEKELLLEKQKLESRVKERTEQLTLTNEGLRDEISKRQAVEKELQEYSKNLARSNAELEDFAYVASHDLQEPLRKIQAFSNLLENEYHDQLGDGADYVRRMHAAAMRMSTLIQDLLAFSRVTTKMNPAESVDLNLVVTDVLSDLEARISDVDGTVEVDPLPTVIADPTHMRQLFQNLIGNALKFHKPGEKAHVVVKANLEGKKFVELSVSDNGIGFDEKYLDRIFSVFQRLHGRDVYEGTGIGLAVCRKIAERYGGSITATSQKDNGATFIVRLPRTKEEK